MLKNRIEETIALSLLDGLIISAQEAKALLESERMPRNGEERLIVNAFRTAGKLSDYIGTPFSAELILEFRDLLSDGVDYSALRRTVPPVGLMYPPARGEIQGLSDDEVLQFISDYANAGSDPSLPHPAIRALGLCEMVQAFGPFPDVNTQVGRLMFQLHALKNGLPVLGMLPITKAKILWERGSLVVDTAVDREGYRERRHIDYHDATDYVTLSLDLALHELTVLEQYVERAAVHDDAVLRMIVGGSHLNYRQRAILATAVMNSDAEFTIARHRANYGITYATARSDLRGLTEAGHLECHDRGHALVFSASDELRSRLDLDDDLGSQIGDSSK